MPVEVVIFPGRAIGPVHDGNAGGNALDLLLIIAADYYRIDALARCELVLPVGVILGYVSKLDRLACRSDFHRDGRTILARTVCKINAHQVQLAIL